MEDDERRKLKRHILERIAELRISETVHYRSLGDLSGGGASIQGVNPTDESKEIEISLDGFGEFSGSVVREWDDGFAITFDLHKDDQISFQDDIDAFMRKNDTPDY